MTARRSPAFVMGLPAGHVCEGRGSYDLLNLGQAGIRPNFNGTSFTDAKYYPFDRYLSTCISAMNENLSAAMKSIARNGQLTVTPN
jgi:hypothetical protein